MNVKIVWKYSVIVEEMGLTEGIFTQVKAAVGMKATLFWDVVPCSLVVGYQCFRTCSPDFLAEGYHKDEGPCSFENLTHIYLSIKLHSITVSPICQTAVSQYHLSIKLHCHSITHLWNCSVSVLPGYQTTQCHSITYQTTQCHSITYQITWCHSITYQTTHIHIPEERSLDSHFRYSLRLHERW
jgi:hypothetical protein